MPTLILNKQIRSMKGDFKIIDCITTILIILWAYTASSKLLDFSSFRAQMLIQAIPVWLAQTLVYIIPCFELLAVALLYYHKTKIIGLILSLVLLLVFTGYIGLVILNVFDHIPCSCGGVLRSMGWNIHLAFNLFFLLLTGFGIYLYNRERRHPPAI